MHDPKSRSKHETRHELRWALPLAGTYTFVLASVFFWTYLPRYFVSIGWTSTAIGVALGVTTIARSLAHPTWAHLSDRYQLGASLLKWLFFVGVAVLGFLPFVESELAVYVTLLAFGITAGATLPLVDTLTVRELPEGRFGRIRAWGSIGFGVAALTFGAFGVSVSHAHLATWAPWLIFACYVAALGTTLALPRSRASAVGPSASEAMRLLHRPWLLAILPIWALHWAMESPYALFFVFLCEEKGFGGWTPGMGVAFGIAAEVIILSFGGTLTKRVRPGVIFAACVALTALRWILSSVVDDAWLLIGLQTIHGLTFGGFFLSMMAVLDREIPQSVRGTAQALLYVFVFGLGSSAGSAVSGWVVEHYDAERLFLWTGYAELALLFPAVLLMVVRRND